MLIAACASCRLLAYPPPLVCCRCHGTSFDWVEVSEVTVELTTTAPGADSALATVAGDAGPRMIARVPANAKPGDRLPLTDAGAPGGAFVPPSVP